MKTALRIARLELNTLFYSPIAWFLLVVFLFQCGLSYTGVLQRLLTMQYIGGNSLRWVNNATIQIFGLQGGLYGDVLRKVYLYLPLLTMGLISREVNSGTIKLLYSSPVKVWQIVGGKFMAMMAYNFLLVLVLLLLAVLGLFNIKMADPGFIFSGMLAVYLLLCAYSAIGLFMSSLTSYQVVAAISTLVIFAALAYVGSLWQDIDFVRDLTYFLSMSGRAERMIYGLISTKHVMYFVIIVAMFLSFAMIKLQSAREIRSRWQVTARYAGVFALALVIGYITSMPGFIGYYDATRSNSQTLTPAMQQIIRKMDGPLEVTSYINLVDGLYRVGQPDQRNQDMDRWEEYLRFKPDIHFKYVYYYDEPGEEQQLYKQYPGKTLQQIAEQMAYSYKTDISNFKTPAAIKRIVDLKPEGNRYVMQLRYKGQTTFLRLFDDTELFPSETETGAAIKRLTGDVPVIMFAQGQLERNKDKMGDKDYELFINQKRSRNALVNQGFNTDTISPEYRDIPSNIAVLVIADPKMPFQPLALARLQAYMNRGGNLLIAGEPGKQDVLNPLLQPLGVQLTNGMIVQKSKDFAPDMATPLLTDTAAAWSKALRQDFKDSIGVTMPGVAGLTYNSNGPFHVTPLLMTNPDISWLKKGQFTADSTNLTYNAGAGDERKAWPTALALTRDVNGRQQRVVVTGDADFLSNAELRRYSFANSDFNIQLFSWFTYRKYPINTERPEPQDNWLYLNYKSYSLLKTMLLGVLPGILVIFAAILLIRRKRK